MLTVAKLMSTNPVCVSPDDTLAVVKSIFDKVKFHHILVVEQGALVGVISDRDLFKGLSPHIGTAAETSRDLATLNKKVHRLMHRKPLSLTAQHSVMDAVALFNQQGVSCIPVVNARSAPIGILSWRDIMRTLDKSQSNDAGS